LIIFWHPSSYNFVIARFNLKFDWKIFLILLGCGTATLAQAQPLPQIVPQTLPGTPLQVSKRSDVNDEDPKTKDQTWLIYFGQSNANDLLDIIHFKLGKFEPYSILGIEYSRAFYRQEYLDLEWAGHLAKHFEKLQLFEIDVLAILRWKWFPWNNMIKTSLGIGEGLSLATGHPSSESVSQSIEKPLLNYLWLDIRFEIPSLPDWGLDFTLHHRSGVYGLFGASGGSNYLGFGLSRRF
jgi:hypothetical protein